jgi:hypothetical protein
MEKPAGVEKRVGVAAGGYKTMKSEPTNKTEENSGDPSYIEQLRISNVSDSFLWLDVHRSHQLPRTTTGIGRVGGGALVPAGSGNQRRKPPA